MFVLWNLLEEQHSWCCVVVAVFFIGFVGVFTLLVAISGQSAPQRPFIDLPQPSMKACVCVCVCVVDVGLSVSLQV